MPSMTRHQYNTIGDVLASFKGDLDPEVHAAIAGRMASALTGSSSTFKPEPFRDRCLGLRRGPR